MKRCPECRKDYLDDSLLYCLDDGTPLVQGSITDEPSTAIITGDAVSGDEPTRILKPDVTADAAVKRTSLISRLFAHKRMPWIVAGLLLLALLGSLPFVITYFRRASTEGAVVRFSVPLPEKATLNINFDMHNLSVSPDGRWLAFVANYEGEKRLWVRTLDSLQEQAMPGTEGAYSPFWSPDSRYIAFFAGGKLKRVDASGTSLQTICSLSGEVDTAGTWGRDGVILYRDQADNRDKIFRVAASGGAPAILDIKGDPFSRWVHFLPDGRHFLLCEWNAEYPSTRGIHVGSLDSTDTKLLLATAQTRVEYSQGYLLFAREGSLLAQPFDEKNLQLSGEPFPVVERFPYFDQTGWAEFSVSANGVLAYLIKRPPARLVWLDRTGRESGQIGALGLFGDLRLSPDGQRVALTLSDERTISGDIWIHDLARDTATRFAFGPNDDGSAVWSPDGRRLAYFSCCEGTSTPQVMATLRVKDINDTGKGQTPLGPGFQTPMDWSPDGRLILFTQANDGSVKPTLWVLPTDGDRAPFPFLQTQFSQVDGRFSPDGRWVAFVSDETGHNEVYVTRFDHPGEKLRVSTAGGGSPHWRRDGKELFFLAADRSLMAVAVKGGDTFEPGVPASLFRNDSILNNTFDVSADGQRFIVSSATQTQTAPFAVVLNWTADLKK